MQDIENTRHSFAHLLAAAVKRLYPKVKFGIGPAIENGFYYDFGDVKISDADLPKIEKEMIRIAKEGHEFRFEEWDAERAKEYFKEQNQPYKVELIDKFWRNPLLAKEGRGVVGMVYMGDAFLDLCRGGLATPKLHAKGGHVKNTKNLPLEAFKLTRIAGAYWRGDEKNAMLTRIYGVAFNTKKELGEYTKQQEEAEKRDHKKLGRELGLFTFSELVGPGLPLFTPKGAIIFRELQKFSENLKREIGFQEVHIPHLAKIDLYEISGHAKKFKDDIFYVRGKESEFILKPMNCPHHTQIYAFSPKSYRDLPVRFFETTATYRDEQTGELGGLTRVRSITMDDSHIFARENQIESEFDNIIKQIKKVITAFDIKDYTIRLSLRDEKNKKSYLGTDKIWKEAQGVMEKILKKNKINYFRAEGEAAFYGPKMDFMIKDSIGRQWQVSTIQLDLNMPERFKLEYTDEKSRTQRPVMIHSAFLGSIERFMGIMIEHYAGAFPFWLAPEQIWIVPVSEKFNKYAEKVANQIIGGSAPPRGVRPPYNLRVTLKTENETLGKKIRQGQLEKIPYLLIVGGKEEKSKKISVRSREKGDLGLSTVQKFIEMVK